MDEFDFYPPKPELFERQSKGSLSLTIFSMVTFVLLFTFLYEDMLEFILGLVVVLAIHELGHYLLMKHFNYKDVSMLFVPFFGALVKGKKKKYSQKQRIFVAGAGPFPGLVIGTALIVFSEGMQAPWMFLLGLLFLLVNLVNLLPIDPLDGGQLFKLLAYKNNELSLLIFALISSLFVIGVGWHFSSFILILFGFLMGFRVRALQKQFMLHKELKEENVDFRKNYKRLSNKEFSIIKEMLLEHTPPLRKYVAIAEEEEVNKLLSSQVNNLLVAPTKNDASFIQKAGLILVWVAAFLLPVILYFTINHSWIEHAISSW